MLPFSLLQRKIYRGPIDVARHVIRAEAGVPGLFKGLTATLGREVPGNIAMFGVYELLKQQFAQRQGLASTSELGKGSLLMAGGCAGTCFWLACYPMDIIKSNLQVGKSVPVAGRPSRMTVAEATGLEQRPKL